MSDRDADKPEFRNPATRERRAWIDRALASVRDGTAARWARIAAPLAATVAALVLLGR